MVFNPVISSGSTGQTVRFVLRGSSAPITINGVSLEIDTEKDVPYIEEGQSGNYVWGCATTGNALFAVTNVLVNGSAPSITGADRFDYPDMGKFSTALTEIYYNSPNDRAIKPGDLVEIFVEYD